MVILVEQRGVYAFGSNASFSGDSTESPIASPTERPCPVPVTTATTPRRLAAVLLDALDGKFTERTTHHRREQSRPQSERMTGRRSPTSPMSLGMTNNLMQLEAILAFNFDRICSGVERGPWGTQTASKRVFCPDRARFSTDPCSCTSDSGCHTGGETIRRRRVACSDRTG